MKIKLSEKYSNNIIYIILLGVVLGRYAEFIVTSLIFIILLFKMKTLPKFTLKIFLILIIIFLWSSISIIINNYEITKFFQQFFLLSILTIAYSYILSLFNNKYHIIFKKYIDIMYIIACLGLLQFIIYVFFNIDILFFNLEGVKPIHVGSLIRVSSILNEPGYLGSSLSPIIAFIIFDKKYFIKYKFKSIIFFVCFLLTFATISYTILALILLTKFFLYLNKRVRIFSVSLSILVLLLFNYFSSIKQTEGNVEDGFFTAIYIKLTETINSNSSNNNKVDSFDEMNASTYALLVNKWVASHAPSRLFGTGLGTHEQSYKILYTNNIHSLYGLNSEDGYSLYNRIFSEFGYIGVILFFLFLLKFLNIKNIINISVLFFIIAITIRGGHYTLYGTVLFLCLYYISSKQEIVEISSK